MNVQEWAQKIVREAPGRPVVLELGAHHAQDTIQIYDACQVPPRYVAVEASPRNLPTIRQVIGERKVEVVHAAIAGHCGKVVFRECEGNNDASGSIRKPKRHLECFPHITFEHEVEVPATTLDALTARLGIGTVDLIWCDIQGAERDMIAGGQSTLTRTRWLVVEADGQEMYEGQATRSEFETLLPDWRVVDEWPKDANVLLEHK